MTDDQVSFRQESVDSVFSQGAKPFFVMSPPKLSLYTFTFFCLVIFILGSSYFIKLPVHITAIGEVIAGKDYHQIVINEDDKFVGQVLVTQGQSVSKEQTLLQLNNRDKRLSESQLNEITLLINNHQSQLDALDAHYSQNLNNINQARNEQTLVIEQLEQELASENEVLSRYQDSVAKGLSSVRLKDAQKRIVTQVEGNLIKESSVFTSLNARQIQIDEDYKQQKKHHATEIDRLTLDQQRISDGFYVLSPCDCKVDNVLVEKGLPVVAGQAILTLSQSRENSSLMLYVPASQYRDIEEGSAIRVNVASYPSNKYGALSAKVINVSASPIPGNMISKKGQGLADTTYFIVKASVDKVPPNVSLVTGMAVKSDLVIDEVSLFDMVFSFDK